MYINLTTVQDGVKDSSVESSFVFIFKHLQIILVTEIGFVLPPTPPHPHQTHVCGEHARTHHQRPEDSWCQ